MFHKINSVFPIQDYRLIIHFRDGATKRYDVKPLFKKWPAFNRLKKNGLFYDVVVDIGGYGVVWNDEIDLSCDELWGNGELIRTKFDRILSFGDASVLWGLEESTLRKAVAHGRFVNGIDACKFGKQWVVSVDAMRRVYGDLVAE